MQLERQRWICVTLVCLGLAGFVLFTCCGGTPGKGDGNKSKAGQAAGGGAGAASSTDATTGATPWATSTADSIGISVALNAGGYAIGEQVQMRLVVRNWTDRVVSLTFPTAQRFDFMVRKGKEQVWQWSSGMMFAEVVGHETIAPRDSLVFEAKWDQRLADGTNPSLGAYSLQGILKTAPELISKERPFGIVD